MANGAKENVQLQCNLLIPRNQYVVSAKIRIMLAVCRRFRMMETSDNSSSCPEVFYVKRCSSKFHKIHRKTPVPESLF